MEVRARARVTLTPTLLRPPQRTVPQLETSSRKPSDLNPTELPHPHSRIPPRPASPMERAVAPPTETVPAGRPKIKVTALVMDRPNLPHLYLLPLHSRHRVTRKRMSIRRRARMPAEARPSQRTSLRMETEVRVELSPQRRPNLS
jgi:hypothetical protein